MVQYNFEGDTNNISERQLQFINSVILEQGFKNSKILFEPVGKTGDNYAANVKRITINGLDKRIKMIAKIAPTDSHARLVSNSTLAFNNERLMYTEVLPKLLQLQRDANIPETEQLKYAKCYGSFPEEPHEVILLEDLEVVNFTILDKFSPLPNDCVSSVLQNIAILHSLSFVLKHKDQEKYNTFKNNLIDMWAIRGNLEVINVYCQTLEVDILAILEDEEYINLLQGKITATVDLAVKCSETDLTSKYTVIQHGDPWTNNFMFKLEDETLRESVLIDYQLSKNSSPVYDIMYIILNCTDQKTRSKKFYDWIDFYYSELDKSLSNFGLKANLVYPRDILEMDLKQYSRFLFGFSIFSASLILRKTDDAAKLKDILNSEDLIEQIQKLSVSILDEDSKMYFKDKVIGLIETFTEFALF